MVLGRSPSGGKLFPETSLVVDAPSAYFCPLSGSLMLEPVTLVNTGQVRRYSSTTALPPHHGLLWCARAPVHMHIVGMFFGAHGLPSALRGATLSAPLLSGSYMPCWLLLCPRRIYLAYPRCLTAACPTCAGL